MLPSRGVLRSLPSVRATSSISSQSVNSAQSLTPGTTAQVAPNANAQRPDLQVIQTTRRWTAIRNLPAQQWCALDLSEDRLGGLAGTVAIGGSFESRRAFSLWNSKPEPAAPAPTPAAPAAAPAQPPVEPAAVDAASASAPSIPTPEPALAAATPSGSIPDLDAAALLDLPEQIGFLKTLGLDFGWGPSSVMQWAFEHLHVYSGLPWWGSIAATAILLRIVMFKPLLMSQDTSARMQKLQQDPKYEEIRTGLQEAMSRGDSAGMAELRRDLSMMNKRAGVNPLNGLWGLLQIPFGYGMFRVLNGAASIPVPGMETGGFLWISDLTVSDPFFLLPIAGPFAMFAMVKLGSRYATPQAKAQQKLMMYILGPLSVIFTAYLPAGVQWYFFITGLVGVLQNWLFTKAGFRNFFGLMPLPSTPAPATTTAPPSRLTYQAPRRAAASAPAETPAQDGSISGVINSLKQTVHNAKGGAGNYMEANRSKEEAKQAKKYAEKRGEQERQKFWSEMRKK
ncbi:LOW QUALITY PROTEIN: mitochondrial inner membrane protein OXA1 [Colletotrichum spaethianum]|uniref:Mitochondrial inner membrane protein OXA1 n=1 Tax=Colletotrichum spaethianum TaxID=700344 RepID=A0AA37L867_9PEZI|nr:LOW QUALITY PROTEIN: mitochondrial inner membrane protein OXA1 [Colletotrichum spaethianum]GKT41215.1 LOW QUALITY PROTEIN: mitochondrial inner membrane protein OXA1 [Colletotrichum spaethianum]